MRRTKIIVTLGPATDQPGVLEKLFTSGMDAVRLNYSHQTHEDHERRVREVRELSLREHRAVGIIADLQGPKIRIHRFNTGSVELHAGDTFVFDTDLAQGGGDEHHVGVSYKNLPRDVKAGDTLLVDDGRIS
ncbi:MAG: pyruvate kinase, partial [Thiotrichales bacterium]|nr:pyruvate kinase [Thiotrichales bacterium]